jgi:hypothetical protein
MQESFEWVLKVLKSCENGFHMECAKKLVECFHDRYGDGELYQSLLEEINKKEPLIMVV